MIAAFFLKSPAYLFRDALARVLLSISFDTKENIMKKTIDIHGQRVELYRLDDGRTWSSNPQSTVAYEQRREILRLAIQQKCARIDDKYESNRSES